MTVKTRNMKRLKKATIEKTGGMVRRAAVYCLKDWVGILVACAVTAKSIYFSWIIASQGAAIVFPDPRFPLFGTSYVMVLFSAVLISVAWLFNRHYHVIALIVIDLLFSILLIGDMWYFRGFNDFLSLHMLAELRNLHNLSDSVFAMFRKVDILFLADIPVIIAVAFLIRKWYRSMKRELALWAALFVIPFLALLYLHHVYDFNGNTYRGPYLFYTQFKPYDSMQSMTPIGYHMYDTFSFIEDNAPFSVSDDDKARIEQWIDGKNEKLPPNSYFGIFKGKNLIVIQIESLEEFVIGSRCDGLEITPNLNKMLEHSLYFPNFYEQTNNGNSADCDLLVNTSVLPVRRGAAFYRFPTNRYNSLAAILKREGYLSRSIHADDGICWNSSRALPSLGFDHVMAMGDFPKGKVFWMGLTDESLFEQVADLLEKETKPAFYFTVTVTSHMPFRLPDEMHRFDLSGFSGNTLMKRYFQAIHYTDRAIGRFIETLRKKNLLDDTVIVIYGDHRGVHKYYSDEVRSISGKNRWRENDERIPLFIYQNSLKGKKIMICGGQVDVLPTLCYSMGVNPARYEGTSLGRNLLNTKRDFAVLNDGRIAGRIRAGRTERERILDMFDISELVIRADYFGKKSAVRGESADDAGGK